MSAMSLHIESPLYFRNRSVRLFYSLMTEGIKSFVFRRLYFGISLTDGEKTFLSIYLMILSRPFSDHLRWGGWLNLEFSKG